MSCNLSWNKTDVETNIKSMVGSDEALFNAIMSGINDTEGNLEAKFVDYCKNRLGEEIDEKTNPKDIAKMAMDYYADNNFKVGLQTKDSAFNNEIKALGYTNTAAKVAAIRQAANYMLMCYHNDTINGILEKHVTDRKNNLANRAITLFKNNIATIICQISGKPATQENKARTYILLNDVNSPQFAALEKAFAGNSQYRNQLAAYKDMVLNKSKFFEQVTMTDSRLGEIRFRKDDELDDIVQNEYANGDFTNEEDSNQDSASDNDTANEKDSSTSTWSGDATKSDFMKDYDFAIRSYLSTIPRLSSHEKAKNGNWNFDTSNPLGMVDYMDCKEVISAIQGDKEVTNINIFKNKLRAIATANPSYAGLAYLADDLDKHKDFAYKVFRVFQRSTITKVQSRIDENGNVKVSRSNAKADKLETIMNNFLNDVKSSSLNYDEGAYDSHIKELIKELSIIKTRLARQTVQNGKDKIDNISQYGAIEDEIARMLKNFYPSVDVNAVYQYCRLNKVGDKVDIAANCTTLLNILSKICSGSVQSVKNKHQLDTNYAKAKSELDDARKNKASKEVMDKLKQNLNQASTALSLGFLHDDVKANTLSLANHLMSYSVVHIDCNSVNALGNQSADQINDSMITNFLNALKGSLLIEQKDGNKVSVELANYGAYKFQGNQYNLSNILLEHRDANGNIINRGLFYLDAEGNYEITDYARDMMDIYLFDGAGDLADSKNVLYSGMSKGDYVYTGFSSYFNAEQGLKNMSMGNYFMRIPSDAPKNFMVHMPKYNVDGLCNFTKSRFERDDVNITHPIAQQFKQAFMQELTDMANTINVWFETDDNGQIQYNDDGTPKFKKGWGLDEESARRCFKDYHIGSYINEKGKRKYYNHFIVKEGNGWKLTGNVFKSDRFVITNHKTGVTTNYGQKLLDYAFKSLYGGDITKDHLPFTKDGNKVVVVLEPDQEALVDRMIKGFIAEYINESVSRMNEYKNLDVQGLITTKNIADFILNHRLAYIGFNDLFEGDTKFYKDTQTFLKRAKESQASGVPYGFVDTSLDLRQNSTEVQDAYLNTKEVQDRLSKLYLDADKKIKLEVKQKTKFNGITIKNTVRTSEQCKIDDKDTTGKLTDKDGSLVRDLVHHTGLSVKEARKLMKGFGGTTVNDAQSYITFEEWIRRIAGRGQLSEYLPLIEAICDRSKPVPANLMKKFVQVQKNFYYDQYYDEATNTITPRQIKNAEFVLIPRFIEGTDLEKVYKAMKDNGIDQLNTEETSKAGKARVLTLFDTKTGKVSDEHIQDFNNVAQHYREEYDYNHLYTQQETPQHMNAKNKAGIQIMKKILDNISKDSPLYKFKEAFTEAYVANIKESYNNIIDELKIPRDKDGNIEIDDAGNIKGIDMNVFFKKLKDECMRLGLDSNMMDYVTLNADSPISIYGTPNPLMPTYLSMVANKLESISQSVFNSAITRQTLPGFHAAQITNVGFSKQLRYHPVTKEHPDGERYVEIMLPKSNFGFAKNEDGTYKKTDDELLTELQEAGLDTIIGYRIPTEGKQSVCVMKVVGFLDDAQGSTIVVPDDWVSQTGSDFDIDSVYGVQYTTKLDDDGHIKKIEYDKSLSADENNRDQRNNYILDNMIEILKADESLEENLARSNFDEISDAKKLMVPHKTKDIRDARSPYDFYDQAEYQEDVMSGAKLKAFSVTRDTFCSVCNTVKPRINKDYRIAINYGKAYDYDTLVKRFGEDNVELTKDKDVIVRHTTLGWSNDNKNVSGFLITTYSSQTTALILDAVKEGCVPNVNDYTFKVFKTFPDVGADYNTAVAFIMQPAVTEIVKAYNAGKSIYADSYGNNPINEAIMTVGKQILDKYNIKYDENITIDKVITEVNDKLGTNYGLKNHNSVIINTKQLQDRLDSNDSRPVEDMLVDWSVLFAYNDYAKLADSIGKNARVCNPDRFGAKQTIFDTRKVFDTIEELAQEEKPLIYTKGANGFVESIYPGVVNDKGFVDIRKYLKSDKMSTYPSLNAFLKYATAPSIVINQMLFDTEQPRFRVVVEDLNNAGYRDINEGEYKDYKHYILNSAWNQTDAIENQYSYDVEHGVTKIVELDDDIDEQLRIFGYGCEPKFDFKVVSKTHPTQEEVDAWSKLSPAQKIYWLKKNSVDAGIFNFIDTNLYNEYEFRTTGQTKQTIKFNEDKVDNETAYNLFEIAYNSTNPLVKLAAMDVIKYAFAVEGFKIHRNGVAKCIKNSCLRDSNTFVQANGERTSILEQINKTIPNVLFSSSTLTNYVRANNPKCIKHTSLRKVKNLGINVSGRTGLITLDTGNGAAMKTALDKGLLNSYYEYKGEPIYEYPNFVYIDNIPYKVINNNELGNVYYYPLRKLEKDENNSISINNANNDINKKAIALPNFYESLIESFADGAKYDIEDINKSFIDSLNSEKIDIKKIHKDKLHIMQDIADNNVDGAKRLVNAIVEHFVDSDAPLIIKNMYISNKLKYGETLADRITAESNGSKLDGIFKFQRASKKDVALTNLEYDSNCVVISRVSETKIKPIKDTGTKKASSRLDIELTTNTDSVSHTIVKELNRRKSLGDIEAGKITRRLSSEGFTQTKQGYSEFESSIFYSGYAFLKDKVAKINVKLNQFYRDNNGDYYAINSAETIEAIKNNTKLRNDYLELLADARAIIDKFAIVNDLNDSTIEDASLKYYVVEMKKLVNDLNSNTIINDAEIKFGTEYLQKLSNDPNVQNDLINIFDGFHSSGFFDSWIGDLQEQGNTMVQVTTRKMLADIRAKDAYAAVRIEEYKKGITDIKARAAKEGLSIDYDKFIDDLGRIIRPYNNDYVEDYHNLKENFDKAKVNIQSNPKEYVLAKHRMEKFLLDNVNREYVDDYYKKLYDAEDNIIERCLPIYAEYAKLNERVRQINSYRIDGELTPDFEKELYNIRKKIQYLKSEFDEADNFKPDYEQIPGTERMPDDSIRITNQEVYNKAIIGSRAAAIALNNYIKSINTIKDEYSDKTVKEGFVDMLNKMLTIVRNAENRDGNGKLGVPMSQLLNNKEYQKAKEWLANNARWEVNDEIKAEINQAYKDLGIESKNKAKKLIKEHIKNYIKTHPDEIFYDEYGNLDGSKFPEKLVKQLHDIITKDYNVNNVSYYSDRTLINSAPNTDDLAPMEFYQCINSGGTPNQDYLSKITDINEINRKYYNSSTKRVETSKMTLDDLKQLKELYDDLDALKKKSKGPNSRDAFLNYSKYVEEVPNKEAIADEDKAAKQRTEAEFYTLWKSVNYRHKVLRDKDGKVVIDEVTGKPAYDYSESATPNPYLYCAIKPNEDYWKSLSVVERNRQKKNMELRSKAFAILHNRLETINTPQYDVKKNEMLAKGEEEYKKWYDENHVYNPFTHAFEPIPIWTRTTVAQNSSNGRFEPSWLQIQTKPKDGYANPFYKEDFGNIDNYKGNTKYYNKSYNNLNKYEVEMINYIQGILKTYATTESAKRYVEKGYLPYKTKKPEHDLKWAGKQAKEFIGFSDMLPSGKDSWYEHIDYSEDRIPDMPMLVSQLKDKNSINLDDIYKAKPKRETFKTDEEYSKALDDYQKRLDAAKANNEAIHKKLLDRDFEGAIEEFIGKAIHFNAVQDNKQLMFYVSRMLGKTKAYTTTLGWSNLRKDTQSSTNDETQYLSKVDTQLKQQFDNWVRRLLYSQFKKPNNKFTKAASMLQSFTSAKFMMLNITGGIGNVTVGEASIFGEYIAKEYFSPIAWAKGKKMWTLASTSFLQGLNSDKSTSLADAIVKFMNIVDFDEVNNRPTVNLDADAVLTKFRDFMYSPNAMGEHFMQNGAMFSMMFDNRLIPVPEAESNGRLPYEAMTLSQYMDKCQAAALKNIIGDNEELKEEYDRFIEAIKADDNVKKEYVWNRKDPTREFLKKHKDLAKPFMKERDRLEKEAKTKFETYPTVMEQLDLKDGKMSFKEGSLLDELNKKSANKEVPDGYLFMGYFKGKVISVNKKIHGVYDKLGAAQIENEWWGALAMQYHKHIYPGIMKHYRRKGYFNEERGTREIGCAPALFDFLGSPIKDAYVGYNEADKTALESLQILLKGYAELATNLKTNWYLMPRWQRASIMRAAGDAIGALAGICLALAVRCLYDDDELKNSTWANLMLYEADELATQSMMYNAVFVPGQANQLWSSPIAGTTAAKDIYSAINNIASYIMDDDYDPTYTTGRYVGQNKIAVKLGRQIPIYRAITNITTLDKANSYYKTSENILNIFDIKGMAENIREGESHSTLER